MSDFKFGDVVKYNNQFEPELVLGVVIGETENDFGYCYKIYWFDGMESKEKNYMLELLYES